MRRAIFLAILAIVTGFGVYSCAEDGIFVPGLVSAYLLFMLLPGAGLYLLIEKEPNRLELILSSVVLSPILTGLAVVLAMALGIAVQTAVVVVALASFVVAAAALVPKVSFGGRTGVSAREALVLAGIIVIFCILIGYLPFTEEWWRIRSDAWFHSAVIAQIAEYGIPPQDPYFLGMPLQYMWVYHVYVLALSQATNIPPTFVMPLFNVQAIIGFILATYLLSFHFRKRFAHGISSALTALLGMNALFWLFLPIKLGRAFTGEVRGMEELSRIFMFDPFNIHTVRSFLSFGSNQVFFLDKFIVMTPFSFGLCFMAAAWYGVAKCFGRKGAFPIVLTFLVSTGMLAFHTVAGIIMLASFMTGLVLLQLNRSQMDRKAINTSLMLLVALTASAVVLSPYLYALLHGKESTQLLPFGISFKKTLGIVISCALGLILAAFQVKKLLADRVPGTRAFLFISLCTIIFCLIIVLPGPNQYDKPPFFVFYPLAVVGGWTLAELPHGKRPFFRRRAFVGLLAIVLFLPVNLLTVLGYINTTPKESLTSWEREVAAWVRVNTSRDAVFIENNDHVIVSIAGPRRYYYGRHSYSYQWGYNKEEMARRKGVLDNLYSNEQLERSTLDALSALDEDVYVIVRDTGNEGDGFEKCSSVPHLLKRVYSSGPITVLEVDKNAFREEIGVGSRSQ